MKSLQHIAKMEGRLKLDLQNKKCYFMANNTNYGVIYSDISNNICPCVKIYGLEYHGKNIDIQEYQISAYVV